MPPTSSTASSSATTAPDVALWRLYVLRAMYALMLVGLALQIWPLMLHIPRDLELMKGVVRAVLTAISLLAALGIRYPLQMLPLLFFELAWKVIWCGVIGLPLLLSGHMDANTRDTWNACLIGVILVPIAMPWGYVWAHYVKKAGDPWTSGKRTTAEFSVSS